ncbi:MAG: hypothetical protein WB566_10365 [Terriglobales bacterium]
MSSVRSAHLLGLILLLLAILAVPSRSFAQGVAVSITIAPPVLPVYTQPVCPGEGYLWTPGYWAWDPDYDDYYWVPGTWVEAPEVGFLWTPGYWGWNDGGFIWNAGYWGPNIGFYGGVDYGFGYMGTGFEGGYWRGNNFYYNTSVMNVNRTIIHDTYTKTVVHNMSTNRVSYNGGTGGLRARPTSEQEKYASERHIPMTSAQTEHQRTASGDRSLRASVNHGRPPVAATAKPADFKTGTVAARTGGPSYTKTAANRGNEKNGNAGRAAAKPSKEAATEHAKSARPEKNAAPAAHEGMAKTEPKASSKPAKSEHATARPAEPRPAEPRSAEAKTAAHENAARTEPKPEPKASKASRSEHAATRPAEPKPAVEPRENQARSEAKPARETKPAKSEHATARPAETKPAAAPHERMEKPEPKAPKPTATERAKAESPERPSPAHAASAPKTEHRSQPKPVSKPAPAKEEKKPPQ